MRILSLSIRDFRGVEERTLEPARDGVTVVAGPNEVGKTSLAEALDLLFDRLDSSVAQEVRDAQPVGRDVGPEVEAEIAAGDYRFRYRKRFLRRPETVLRVTAPRAEDHTGREAHERVEAILEEAGVDLDLWRALRVQQGAGVAQPQGLASASSLLDALGRVSLAENGNGDAEGGAAEDGAGNGLGEGGAVGRRGADLHARARSEYERCFTPKRGEPSGELRAAREELSAAQEAAAKLEEDMAHLEGDAARAGELERALVRLRAEHREASERERRHAAEAARVRQLGAEVEGLRGRLGEAQATLDLLRDLENARQREGELAGRLQAARREVARAEAELRPAVEALEAARGARQTAEAERERRREVLRLVESLEARRAAAEDLEGRARRARETVARLTEAESRLAAEAKVEAGDVARLERDEREIEKLESALEAASPRLALRALADLVFDLEAEEGGGEDAGAPSGPSAAEETEGAREVHLAHGETWERRPAAPLRLTLPGVAELTVAPGGDAVELRRRLGEARQRLRQGCADLGVDGVPAAREALARRRQAATERDAARALLAELLGTAGGLAASDRRSARDAAAADADAALARLETRRAEAAAEMKRSAARLGELVAAGSEAEAGSHEARGAVPPPTVAEAEESLQAARRAEEQASATEETARTRAEDVRSAFDKARSTERELVVELRNAAERRQRAGERAAELLARRHPEAADGETEAGGKMPGTAEEGADQMALFAAVSAAGTAEDGDGRNEDPAAELEAARRAAEERVAEGEGALAQARRRLAEAKPGDVERRAEEAAAAVRDAGRRLRQAEDELLTLRTRLDSAGERGLYEDLEEARGRRAAAVAAAAAVEARAAAARRLLRALDDAREAARRAYSEPLRRTIEELGAPLFGDDFAVELGPDLTVVRRTAFGLTLETERLSTGAQEQLSLLSRLACAVLVSPSGGVPLILDDALGNTDPRRSAAMAEVLARAGERCQVLVLTCAPQRYRGIPGARVLDLEAAVVPAPATTGDEESP